MNGTRVSSSPDLSPLSTSSHEDLSLEGIATNVKLLLKLVEDHQEAYHRGMIDERRAQRFAGMMTILDDVKTRIQKSQSQTLGKKSKAELRRCNTNLRANNPPRDPHNKELVPLILDEKERLRRDLNTSYATQKRVGVMCASIGREKDIISRELTRKVQEFNEMEELVNHLKAQNQRLSAKIQTCVAEHKDGIIKCGMGSETLHINYAGLQNRNKELSEQLHRSLEGYKSMKRRVKEGQEEKEGMQAMMEEVGVEIEGAISQIQSLKQHVGESASDERVGDIEEKVNALECVFERLQAKVSRYRKEGQP